MHQEVEVAVKFLSDFLRSKNNSHGRLVIKKEQVEDFGKVLKKALLERFHGHWHPLQPVRGSGFRCIINQNINKSIDPVLLHVGRSTGIQEFLLRRFLPVEMALWIDPEDVSYRIGEQGSLCSLLGEGKEDSLYQPVRSRTPEKRCYKITMDNPQFPQPAMPPCRSPEADNAETSNPHLASDDSGIELSPSTSPRPHATISNSSSPSTSPLASPIRDQPLTSMTSCKEAFQMFQGSGIASLREMSSLSPSKINQAICSANHLTSFVR